MAPITLKKSYIDDLAGDLITGIVGVNNTDPNYAISMEYVMSNFRFHRYLDVNSVDVTKLLNGLKLKFCVNSQDEKANELEKLIKQFFGQPLLGDDKHIDKETEPHYSLLLLLLNLSDRPLWSEFKPSMERSKENEGDNFDWKKYLLSGEEVSLGVQLDDELEQRLNNSDEEDWIISDDDDDDGDDNFLEKDASNLDDSSFDTKAEGPEKQWLSNQSFDSQSWLETHLTTYWLDDAKVMFSLHGFKNVHDYKEMCNNWELHIKSATGKHKVGELQLITENQLVRETIWMLQGVKSAYVYTYQDKQFTVRSDIVVSHLTKETLASYLTSFTDIGVKVVELNEFALSAGNNGMSKTLSAFAYVLGMFLKNRNKVLSELEKVMIAQKEAITLSILKNKLTRDTQEILCVYRLYNDTVVRGHQRFHNPTERVVHFLDVFYEVLASFDALGDTCLNSLCIILTMFLDVCQPYFHDVEQWMTMGELPGDEEFMIYNSQTIKREDASYWTDTFKVKEKPLQSGESYTLVPRLLLDVHKQIFLAGKSVGLLSEFGAKSLKLIETVSLHEEFKRNLIVNLQEANNKFLPDETDFGVDETEGPCLPIQNPFVDSLVTENFCKVFYNDFLHATKEKQYGGDGLNENDLNEESVWSDLLKNGSCRPPIKLLIQQSLFPAILKRYDKVCKDLLRMFYKEFSLVQHLQVMNNYFLMEDGGSSHNFCTEVFQKAKEKSHWQNKPFLNIVLQDAIQPQHLHLTANLSVELESQYHATTNSTLFDGLSLHYKVPWPVSIFLNTTTEGKYNEIFKFLFKVKRSIWALEQLRFTELIASSEDIAPLRKKDLPVLEPSQQRIKNRMLLVRMKMLHVVRNFHFYLMTRIQNTTCKEFEVKLKEAKDLNEILELHQVFLANLKQRCFLREKIGRTKEAIFRILSLVFDFEGLWLNGLKQLDVQKLNIVEKEFNRCTAFLRSFFNSLAKRGSYPHFEFLANSLKTESLGHQSAFRR